MWNFISHRSVMVKCCWGKDFKDIKADYKLDGCLCFPLFRVPPGLDVTCGVDPSMTFWWWKKTSEPSAIVMKPKPFCEKNFTFPC